MASPSPIETNRHVPATVEANVAFRGVSRSCAGTHQREARTSTPLSRGHCVHVVSNQHQERGLPSERALTLDLLTNWRGSRPIRVLFPHSHWRAVILLPLLRHRPASRPLPHRGVGQPYPVRAFHRCAGGFYPKLCEHAGKHLAKSLHHNRSFRNLASSDGSRTIGKAFDEWTKMNFGIGQK